MLFCLIILLVYCFIRDYLTKKLSNFCICGENQGWIDGPKGIFSGNPADRGGNFALKGFIMASLR
jgi:hypothetical protein